MSEENPTRRERYRRQTVTQIKAAAMAQVHAGGAQALSLHAIARSMAMSPPALYRYFGSRDELLAELVVDVHLALAENLEAVAACDASPPARLRAVAEAFRGWALAEPNAYHLAYGQAGSGLENAAQRIAPAAQRSMNVLLGVVAEAGQPPAAPLPAALEQQIRRWNGSGVQHGPPTWVLYVGLVWWSRLHGLISLELAGHLAATEIDPALLYRAEVEAMLDSLGRPEPPTSADPDLAPGCAVAS